MLLEELSAIITRYQLTEHIHVSHLVLTVIGQHEAQCYIGVRLTLHAHTQKYAQVHEIHVRGPASEPPRNTHLLLQAKCTSFPTKYVSPAVCCKTESTLKHALRFELGSFSMLWVSATDEPWQSGSEDDPLQSCDWARLKTNPASNCATPQMLILQKDAQRSECIVADPQDPVVR
jgi:hypothetical protein